MVITVGVLRDLPGIVARWGSEGSSVPQQQNSKRGGDRKDIYKCLTGCSCSNTSIKNPPAGLEGGRTAPRERSPLVLRQPSPGVHSNPRDKTRVECPPGIEKLMGSAILAII